MDLTELLTAISGRGSLGEGISLASAYVHAIGSCLGDEGCRQKFFVGSDPPAWSGMVKESSRRLTYRNPDMILESGIILADGGVKETRSSAYGRTLTPGACMDFECVVTSTRKDRDADVLESSGAEPDANMPLLWQHIPLLPCGRMLEVVSKDAQQVKGSYSVVDSRLGNDAAQLIDFKALRISHGFLPLDFSPLRAKATDGDRRDGWHVKRFKILETSLVSVPSNEDAIITAWSRQKLTHPLVKTWAEGLRRQLPVSARGGWDREMSPQIKLTVNFGPPSKAVLDDTASGGVQADPIVQGTTPCGCGASHGQRCSCHERATTNEWKCPDCKLKLQDGKCPKCGYKRPADAPKPGKAKDDDTGEYSCRLGDPGKYEDFRRQNKKTKEGKPVGLIFGKLKGKAEWELQSIRFPAKSWDEADARSACAAKEGGKFIAPGKAFEIGSASRFLTPADFPGYGEPVAKQLGQVLTPSDRYGSPPMPHLDGSYEELTACLQSLLGAHMRAHGASPGTDDYGDRRSMILGTYPDHAIVATSRYQSGNGPQLTTYHVPHGTNEQGEPVFTGAPQPIDVIMAPDYASMKERKDVSAMLLKRFQAVSSSYDPEDVARILLGMLWQGKAHGLDPGTAEILARELRAVAEVQRRASEEEALATLLS